MPEQLRKGQLPLEDMIPRLRTAHDVRAIRGCGHCGNIGTKGTMIDSRDGHWWHGRCFVKRFGLPILLAIESDKLARLTLGDLGVDLMRAVMDAVEI